MGKEQYIGGSFASDDSFKYKLKNQKTPFFLQNMNSNKCVLGFETGADALAFVLINWLKNNNKSSIFFPKHYCQDTIKRIKIKVPELLIQYYQSTEDLLIHQPKAIVWNHFNGHIPIPFEIKKLNAFIIEDAVQSIEAIRRFESNALISSFRKWIEEDIAIVLSEFTDYDNQTTVGPSAYYSLKKEAEQIKSKWKKTHDKTLEKIYLELFQKAENLLLDQNIYMKEYSTISQYNWDDLIATRSKNKEYLLSKLSSMQIEIIPQSELFVVINLNHKQRNNVRKHLADNGIFCPIHWLDSLDIQKANSLLSLPIDQRYNIVDMQRIAETLKYALEL